jgi:hypothetical protein
MDPWMRIGSGSTPKCHESATLIFMKDSFFLIIFYFRITFKYDFLAPPRERVPHELRTAPSMNKLESSEHLGEDDPSPMPETEVLWY